MEYTCLIAIKSQPKAGIPNMTEHYWGELPTVFFYISW